MPGSLRSACSRHRWLPAQDRTEREVVELIVRDGPQARAIRAETEVTRREQLARLVVSESRCHVQPGRVRASRNSCRSEQSLPVFGTRDALSRAGVAATAAAEAERDAAAVAAARGRRRSRRSARRRAGTTRGRSRPTCATWNGLIEILRTREREGEGSRFDGLRAEQELRETQPARDVSGGRTRRSARDGLSAMLPRDIFADHELPAQRRSRSSRRSLSRP